MRALGFFTFWVLCSVALFIVCGAIGIALGFTVDQGTWGQVVLGTILGLFLWNRYWRTK